jgi:hypothetical protein
VTKLVEALTQYTLPNGGAFQAGDVAALTDADYDAIPTADLAVHVAPLPSDTGFTPPALPGLHAWYDAAQIAASDGDTIAQWDDESGNGRHLTVSAGAVGPVFKAGVRNGHGVTRWPGVGALMQSPSFTALAQPWSAFVVFRASQGSRLSEQVLGTLGSGSLQAASTGAYVLNGGVPGNLTTSGGVKLNQLVAITGLFSPALSSIRVNGTLGSTLETDATGTVTRWFIGASSVSSLGLNGDIAEIVLYNRLLTDTEAAQVERYLASKWALTIPPGNPFGGSGHVTPAPNVAWRDRTGMVPHILSVDQATADATCAGIASTGAGWLRSDINMHLVNPARGVFDWTATDPLFAGAAKNGLRVLGILDYSTTWASGAADIFHQPTDLADWVNYAVAVIHRYGRGGSFWHDNPTLPVIPLAAVELWNEPWLSRFWLPDPDPVAYAALVRAAAPAIRAADPYVTIVMPADWLQFRSDSTLPPWQTAVTDADPTLPDLIDVYSVHLYGGPKSLTPYPGYYNARIAPARFRLTPDNAAVIGKPKPIWCTEIGWKTVGTETVTEADAATNYVDILARCFQEWGAEKCFLYFYGRRDAANDDYSYGLLREDGTETPAVGAVRSYLAAS